MNSYHRHDYDQHRYDNHQHRQLGIRPDEHHADYYLIPMQAAPPVDLWTFTRIFTSRLKLIGGSIVSVVLLALLYIWSTTPLYSSTTELLIDPRRKQVVEAEIFPSGLGSSAVGGDTLLLDSQIEVLNSQSVIDRLIRDERLMEDREFFSGNSTGAILILKNLVKTVIYGPNKASRRSASAYDKTNKLLRKRVSVQRRRNTYVISIDVLTSNPDKSARLANSLARIYIEETNSAATKVIQEVATNLDQRLLGLSRDAQKAELKVEAYRTENGLIGTQNGLTVEQQLRALTDRLSLAKADSQSQIAIYNQVKLAGAFGDPVLSAGAAASSQVMSNLQTTTAKLESQEADLLSTFLPKHPRLKRLNGRKQAINKSILREFEHILGRLDVKYKSTLETVNALSNEVSSLKTGVADSNSATLKLRQLEREAEANRNIYQRFLARSKDAAKQVGLPNSTARIISVAYPASQPDYPRPLAILAGALLLGLITGVILAWGGHVFSGKPKERQWAPERRAAYLIAR